MFVGMCAPDLFIQMCYSHTKVTNDALSNNLFFHDTDIFSLVENVVGSKQGSELLKVELKHVVSGQWVSGAKEPN